MNDPSMPLPLEEIIQTLRKILKANNFDTNLDTLRQTCKITIAVFIKFTLL